NSTQYLYLSLHDALPISVFVEGFAADCFNYGSISYYSCEICDKYFSDADCQNKIEYQDTVLQPLSHVNKFYHERQDATCYEDGRSEEHTSELHSRFDLVC